MSPKARDLDLEVREGGDDLPFAAAAGEGAHAFDAEVLEGGHDLDLDVGKGVDDLDLAAQRMPLYVQLALSRRRPAPGRARRAGRGRGGSAFFSWGRDGSARPSAFKPSRRASLCRLLGSTSSTRGRGPVAVLRLQRQPDVLALTGVHGVAQGSQRAVRRRGGGASGAARTQVGAGQVQQAGLQRDDVVAVGAPAHRLDGGTADDMLQLAHVARPAVAAQPPRRPAPAQAAQASRARFCSSGRQHVVAALAAAEWRWDRPTAGGTGRRGSRRRAPGPSGCGWWRPRCARPRAGDGRRPGAGSRRSAARAAWPAPAAAVRRLRPGTGCRRWRLNGPVGHRARNAPLAWPNTRSRPATRAGRRSSRAPAARGGATAGARGARTVPCPRRSRPAAGWAVPSPPPRRSRAAGGRWARSGPGSRGCRRAYRRRDWPRVRRSARVSASSRVVRSAASTSMISSRNSDWASAPKVPTSSASSVSTPQGWPSTCRLVPMQSCTGRGSPAMPLIRPSYGSGRVLS